MHLGTIIDYIIIEEKTNTFSKVFVAFKPCIDQLLIRRIPCPATNSTFLNGKNVSKEYHGYLIDKNIYFINKAYRKE